MSDIEDRLSLVEKRLQEAEDRLEILAVVAAYGPTIDGGAVEAAGSYWTEDCVYDSDADEPLVGRQAIETLSARVGSLDMGVAHYFSLPVITLDGDQAVATGHSNTYHREDDRYVVARVSANRWELERVDGRWQVSRRVNRVLDGTDTPRALLRRGVEAPR